MVPEGVTCACDGKRYGFCEDGLVCEERERTTRAYDHETRTLVPKKMVEGTCEVERRAILL